jgi:hypothetical protein
MEDLAKIAQSLNHWPGTQLVRGAQLQRLCVQGVRARCSCCGDMMALAGSAWWSGCLDLCSSEGQRRAQHLQVGGPCQSAALNSLAVQLAGQESEQGIFAW